MNFKRLCTDILNSNKKIRFVGILDSKGILVEQKSREKSVSLLSDNELKMIVYYISDRWSRLQNLQHKLGKVTESITKFEKASTIALFLDKNLILVSVEPKSNNSKITSNLWKIVDKKPAKKRVNKKRLLKKRLSKKRPTKKKSVKRTLVKKRPTKKKSVKRTLVKKRPTIKKPLRR